MREGIAYFKKFIQLMRDYSVEDPLDIMNEAYDVQAEFKSKNDTVLDRLEAIVLNVINEFHDIMKAQECEPDVSLIRAYSGYSCAYNILTQISENVEEETGTKVQNDSWFNGRGITFGNLYVQHNDSMIISDLGNGIFFYISIGEDNKKVGPQFEVLCQSAFRTESRELDESNAVHQGHKAGRISSSVDSIKLEIIPEYSYHEKMHVTILVVLGSNVGGFDYIEATRPYLKYQNYSRALPLRRCASKF